MTDLLDIAWKIGGVISLLAVTVYIARRNDKLINDKILPDMESIKVNLSAINLHLQSVIELKRRADEDHDKLVVTMEKHAGLQMGVNGIRRDIEKLNDELDEHLNSKH